MELNPEYEPGDLKKALKWATVSAQSTYEHFLALWVYPVWKKTAYQRLLESPPSPFFHHIIRVPQSFFDFQTPDHWKGGESTYAHEHAKWEVVFFVIMNKAGAERALNGKEDKVYCPTRRGPHSRPIRAIRPQAHHTPSRNLARLSLLSFFENSEL